MKCVRDFNRFDFAKKSNPSCIVKNFEFLY